MNEHPCLMWSKYGEEITVQSPQEQRAMASEGYRLTLEEAISAPAPVQPEPEPQPNQAPWLRPRAAPEPDVEIPHKRGRH